MSVAQTLLLAAQRSVQGSVESGATSPDSWWETVKVFVDSPAPYSPYSEYLLLLFILWLMARRERGKPDFDRQAQQVLDEKYGSGELSKESYEKYRQELSVRVKR